MRVKLIFNSPLHPYEEVTVELQSNVSEDDIIALFPVYLGTIYNENCSYEIIKE